MRYIAIEEHMLPTEVMRAAGANSDEFSGSKFTDGLDDLRDGGDSRIHAMDEAGIDMQVISAAAHPVQGLAPDLATELSRQLNDKMASVSAAHPTRFRFFATLPISDPQASVHELRRCVQELGSVGVMIHGQTNGLFLDDASMRPILAEIESLAIPLYIHPGFPPPDVAKAYYSGFDAAVSHMLAVGAWGWHVETGLHILRLAAGLVFERFPTLQVIVGHMGENLPFSLARADEWLTPLVKGLSRSVGEQILDQVHLTICGYTTVPPLLCAQAVFGADRLLFSVDYPFSDSKLTRQFLESAPISGEDRRKIAHGNAQRLLKF